MACCSPPSPSSIWKATSAVCRGTKVEGVVRGSGAASLSYSPLRERVVIEFDVFVMVIPFGKMQLEHNRYSNGNGRAVMLR